MKVNSLYLKLRDSIGSVSLRVRIMLLYFAMVLILVPLLNFMADRMIFRSFQSDYSVTVMGSAKQAAKDIEFRKKMYENALLQISFDGELNERLSEHNRTNVQRWENVNYIYNSFGFIKDYLPGVVDFRIYHTNNSFTQDGAIIWEPDKQHEVSGIESLKWFQNVNKNGKSPIWHLFYDQEKQQYIMSLSCSLPALLSPVKGCLYLAVKDNDIFNSLSEEQASKQSEYFLVSKDGTVFSASKGDLVGTNIRKTSYGHFFDNKNDTNTILISGVQKIAAKQQVGNNWQVIVSYSLQQFHNKLVKTKRYFIIIVTLGVIVLGGLLMMVLNNMFSRLGRIGEHMSSIMKGEFDIAIKKDLPDEISALEERFNEMASQLNVLMQEVVTAKILEREQALKVLESKINPHFLYNTLGLIRWEALDNNNKALCNIVDSMAVFYRITLNKGNTTLKIRDELEHVKAYLSIQQFSYQEIVEIAWEVDEDTLDFYTIKLLLQPIVENCYKHGMITNLGHRKIWISIKHVGDDVVFRVEDNGAGISPEKLRVLQEPGQVDGIGICYIRDMLSVYFKDQGEMQIESELGKGTIVTIRIPACSQDLKIGG